MTAWHTRPATSSVTSSDPVLRLVRDRARARSRPGQRSDGARLALAIEGGGMAATVSAGMCVALESLGLIDSFDVVYGSSAGAMNASYTVGRQALERSELYVLAARRGLVDARRAFLGRRPIQLPEVLDSLFVEHPHSPLVLGEGLELRVTAACVETTDLHVLADFRTLDDVRTAVRASAAIPVLAGDVVDFRGHRYVDGGLLESIPYRAALREGATHVLVLRSRHARYRKRELRGAARRAIDGLLRGAPATVAEMVRARPARYNAQADDLERRARAGLAGRVTQIAPSPGEPSVRQLESRPARLLAGLALGAETVHAAFAPPHRYSISPRPKLASGISPAPPSSPTIVAT